MHHIFVRLLWEYLQTNEENILHGNPTRFENILCCWKYPHTGKWNHFLSWSCYLYPWLLLYYYHYQNNFRYNIWWADIQWFYPFLIFNTFTITVMSSLKILIFVAMRWFCLFQNNNTENIIDFISFWISVNIQYITFSIHWTQRWIVGSKSNFKIFNLWISGCGSCL